MVVEQWTLARMGLEAVVPAAGVQVVGSVATALEGFRVLRATGAGMVVVGGCADSTPIAVVRRARAETAARVVVVLPGADAPSVIELCAAGALAVVSRDAPEAELLAAISHAMVGERYVAPQVLAGMFDRPSALRPPARPRFDLTRRESAVLAELAAGRTNSEIAERLCIGAETVKTHLGNIYAKLAVRRRDQAVGVAIKHGLV